MLEETVRGIIKKYLETKYPHALLPAVVRARVIRRKDMGAYYELTLKILDKNGGDYAGIPELPGVRSKSGYMAGTVVVAALLYGELNPYILGEAL